MEIQKVTFLFMWHENILIYTEFYISLLICEIGEYGHPLSKIFHVPTFMLNIRSALLFDTVIKSDTT